MFLTGKRWSMGFDKLAIDSSRTRRIFVYQRITQRIDTMRHLPICALLCFALAGCESHRPAGPCIGLNGDSVPGVKYEYSSQNIIIGIAAVELIAPPVIVVLKELKCPVSPSKTP
jgi:hypothetical protein